MMLSARRKNLLYIYSPPIPDESELIFALNYFTKAQHYQQSRAQVLDS